MILEVWYILAVEAYLGQHKSWDGGIERPKWDPSTYQILSHSNAYM